MLRHEKEQVQEREIGAVEAQPGIQFPSHGDLGSSDPPESRLLALRLLALGLVVLVCAVTDGPS